ncbi:hypothetical protein KIN20_037361 [Parelaphostrongylus tenuis]|uniref:WASH complex subunit strumpellin n=1 Tax=Parelaphostrongylus tenuis TaxID=148309 RepID=A0AAD5WM16_PARTN|nr:hypothetical protein KIN20_037361 [Parelaphostrongylus tenuis]
MAGTMASEAFMLRVKEEANCILAEIVRLASFIPQDFTDPKSSKFKLLLMDFSYFTNTTHYEKPIEENEDLQDQFYNINGDLLSRFSTLFQTMAIFLCSLKEYADQVGNDRIGISYLDVVDIEILFYVGLVLLYFEKFLPGALRERIYVAIYRNSDEQRNVDFLVDFLRVNSPSEINCLFERLKMNETFIDRCLSCCETIHKEGANDFGKQHVDRNTLIKWIFVCLLFKPSVLRTDNIKMRQIVENFFRDDWVLQLGLGLNINMIDAWQHYRAAFVAITNQMDIKKAKEMASFHYTTLGKLTVPQGKISPVDFDAHSRLIAQYNSSLRWLILHTSETATKKALSYVQAVDVHPQLNAQLLILLLRLSNFEMNFFTAYSDCLRNKEESIKKLTSSTCSLINELVQFLSGDFGSLNKDKKTKLHDWFLLMKKTLEDLDPNSKQNGGFVIQIKKRIIQVGEMLDLSGRVALAQHLRLLESHLDSLSCLYGVREEEERRLRRSADPSYLWPILDDWTPRIQRRILESSNAHALRPLFFKLSLSVSVLCEQFENDERKRLIGRAYSFHLERRLRVILQSIPNKLFSILRNTLSPLLQTHWEPNMDKAVVRARADFEENFHFAEVTFTISNLSLGISRMALRKVGVVSVNPKELLEEGIRRELASELPLLLAVSETPSSLEDLLKNLSDTLHSFHRAFIYMCGHVDINGYDMWRSEVDCILMQMTKDVMEKRHKTTQAGSNSVNSTQALSVITDLLLKHSNPNYNRYMEDSMTWREVKTKKRCTFVKNYRLY